MNDNLLMKQFSFYLFVRRCNAVLNQNTLASIMHTLWMKVSETCCTVWQSIDINTTQANKMAWPPNLWPIKGPVFPECLEIIDLHCKQQLLQKLPAASRAPRSPLTDVKTLLPFWELKPKTLSVHRRFVWSCFCWHHDSDRKWGALHSFSDGLNRTLCWLC